MAILAGTRLGPYEVVAQIAVGGMGEVYRARDTRLDRTVAIKVLPSHFHTDTARRKRFEREARLISSLNHPHICVLLDVGQQGETDFLVMEYLEGQTLADRLLAGRLPIDEILTIGIEVAEALDRAHREGVIHRDLKPGNIMLTASGAKLLDFGLAKMFEEDSQNAADVNTLTFGHTTPGLVLGTISYMSPEQARGIPLDARTDIWSLGVVLYQMATGKLPFQGATATDTLSCILLTEPPALTQLTPDLPERFDEIVRKALCKNCDDRYQTVRDLLTDLKRLKQKLDAQSEPQHGVPAAVARLPQGPVPRPFGWGARHYKWPAMVAIAAVAVVIAGAVSLTYGAAVAFVAAGILAAYAYTLRGDSVAVMPFAWTGSELGVVGDPEREYLADGITESIINSISQLARVKVISRSSVFRYKGRDIDPQTVARDLGVRKILTGRLLRHGNDLVISVELLDGQKNVQVWGRQYERKLSGLVSAPAQIASEISENLRARWNRGAVPAKAYPANSEAYQAYLRGRFFWNKRTADDLKKAIDCYHDALAKDPKYALAYVGLADSYVMLGVYSSIPLRDAYQQAKTAALMALQIDDSLAEAHASLALVKAGDWDLGGALREFASAIELNPNYATAHQWYAEHLICAGRSADAIAEIRRALELDPLSLAVNSAAGLVYWQAREYERALAQLQKTIEMDKNFYVAHRILRDVYVATGRYEEAIAEHEAAAILAGENPETAKARTAAFHQACASFGPHGYWQERLTAALQNATRSSGLPYDLADTSAYHLAIIYARLGQEEQAVTYLGRALEERDYGMFYIKTNPAFDSLRAVPAVREIMRRIGVAT